MSLLISEHTLSNGEVLKETQVNLAMAAQVPFNLASIISPQRHTVLRPQHAAILTAQYGLLKPESPVEGLFAVLPIFSVIAILYNPETQRKTVTVFPPASSPTSFYPEELVRQFCFLQADTAGPIRATLNLVYFDKDEERAQSYRLLLTVPRTNVWVTAGQDIVLKETAAITLARDTPEIKVLYLPTSVLSAQRGQFSKAFALGCDPAEASFHKQQEEIFLFIKTTEQLFEPVGTDRLFLCYDGDKPTFEMNPRDKSRSVLAAVRRNMSVESIQKLIEDNTTSRFEESDVHRTVRTTHLLALRMIPLPEPWCEICGRPGRFQCTGCLGASYCSANHQMRDWKEHKSW